MSALPALSADNGDLDRLVPTFVVMQFDGLLVAHSYARSQLFFLGWWFGGIGVLQFFWSRLAIRPMGGLEPNGSA